MFLIKLLVNFPFPQKERRKTLQIELAYSNLKKILGIQKQALDNSSERHYGCTVKNSLDVSIYQFTLTYLTSIQ